MLKTIEWVDGAVRMIDQLKLPLEEVFNDYRTCEEVGDAIKTMVIRGAPAIGVAAAMGVALGCRDLDVDNYEDFRSGMDRVCEVVNTRPTAVNLSWAVDIMKKEAEAIKDKPVPEIKERLIQKAIEMEEEDIAINKKMGANGAALINPGDSILTHCNAGALATAGYGTALGVIRAAHEQGKNIEVYVDETRPYLQGSRLTAWEMMKENIPATLITDNMAGWMMKQGKINCVVVGADRIAANGDVANKIGTYSVAVLAKEHNIPFYVAAPTSTVDLNTPDGSGIPIEERAEEEVTHAGGCRVAPHGIKVANPAFDVTPNKLVAAIFTERGVAKAPFIESLNKLVTGT